MQSRGYTLLELLIVLLLITLLSAIVAPSSISFLRRQRVRTAAGIIYETLLNARSQAVTNKVNYSVDFRRDVDGISYCVRQSNQECYNWQLIREVYFSRCTFPSDEQYFSVTTLTISGVCTAQFEWTGAVHGRLGGVYLQPHPQSSYCHGVWTKTLLAALDNGEVNRCQE
ncbi:prepilin-type N-terminal cleavage/methylation domain-containing protein [Coleofasciculus sp. LEGE 07081]|uniref:prepilin-type N-terminal cleavage/methylation domain-containing protein n=1 Tax=Coleofasciculus sp. LEGE 07081 TaxID=2777967 RepID=UPI0018809DF9|nr:prepilin-type N-terminal cleavage/methylation domain-containing protein [Coleofasciculus sp. LEGE 07081]MBE9129427.1 prepilin-type N-terminal cleavage/methylation domain-containing protein [Coleofasciculus sp. LEGE 07081]